MTVHTPDGGTDDLPVAAWVPAASLTHPGWSASVEIPRLELPHNRTTWPAPVGWPSWFAGVWPNGPLCLPAGAQLVTGAAWRRRGRR